MQHALNFGVCILGMVLVEYIYPSLGAGIALAAMLYGLWKFTE